MIAFFRPTLQKLVFLAEWSLFIVFSILRGEVGTLQQLAIISYPLLLFYLVACALAASSREDKSASPLWVLVATAAGLLALDLGIKALVAAWLPYGSSLPLVEGWLNLEHRRNLQGSWMVSLFTDRLVPVLNLFFQFLLAVLLLLAIPAHRYYQSTQRSSRWADTSFVTLSAGMASWLWELFWRRYIVDTLGLPGSVTADLKDIYIAVGVAALVVEWMENPNIDRGWRGWRAELASTRRVVVGFTRFVIQDLRNISGRFLWK
jgi:lipoprotein signal peptidase